MGIHQILHKQRDGVRWATDAIKAGLLTILAETDAFTSLPMQLFEEGEFEEFTSNIPSVSNHPSCLLLCGPGRGGRHGDHWLGKD